MRPSQQIHFLAFLVLSGIWSVMGILPASGQTHEDSLWVKLHTLTVMGHPFGLSRQESAMSYTRITRSDTLISSQPALNLDRLTYSVPGLWVNNRGNYALGERITMRGLGWRSAYGVRGIQVFLDGLPLTTADGQTMLTVVDPSFIRSMRVIRGPASSFWGNSSGGILYLSTQPGPDVPGQVRIRQMGGSYGMSKTDALWTGTSGAHQYQAYGSYLNQRGFRHYSTVRLFRSGLTDRWQINGHNTLLLTGFLASMPEAEHPGSLTGEQARTTPRQARAYYQQSGAGKQVLQGQMGATLTSDLGAGTLHSSVYGLFRNLNNPLPFAYIRVNRQAGGARFALTGQTGITTWGAGYEGRFQHDRRYNWVQPSAPPTPSDSMAVDQLERVGAQAIFAEASVNPGRWSLSGGMRFDLLSFRVHDDLAYPDPGAGRTGHRLFYAGSPSLGVSYRSGGAQLYTSFTTSFEAPTTTELANRPDGSRGFNPSIGPEHTRSLEAGIRGWLAGRTLHYDIAFYAMQVRNILLPYQDANGRTYYVNRGKTRHMGAEFHISAKLATHWYLAGTLDLVRVRFGNGFGNGQVTVGGNRVPGIPGRRAAVELRYAHGHLTFHSDAESVSAYYVNDANTMENHAYTVWNMHMAWIRIRMGAVAVSPFVSLYNLLDTRYNGSVQVNAYGGRYFEPAPGRSFTTGLSVRF